MSGFFSSSVYFKKIICQYKPKRCNLAVLMYRRCGVGVGVGLGVPNTDSLTNLKHF